MNEYNFTLIIEGDVESKMDELFEAGCDDATFGSVDGVNYGEFDREAPSFARAVASAIADVESVEDLKVRRVEPDDLVTAAEIAARLQRSRESIRLIIAGQRRRGDFPAPISHARQRNRLWRWSEVARWAGEMDESVLAHARVVAATNAALELRSLDPRLLPAHSNENEQLIALSQ
jgi:hypothetical protein